MLELKTKLTLPVLVEASEFTSELVVTNWSTVKKTLNCTFVAGAVQASNNVASFALEVNPSEQLILPNFIQRLRDQQTAGIGPRGSSYAGALFVEVPSGDLSGIAVAARASAPGGGGQYGLFYTAVPAGVTSTDEAWLYGLQQNSENRTNVAIVNSGETDGNSNTFRIDIYDGSNGLKVNTIESITLGAKRWMQLDSILTQYAPATAQGYAKVTRTSGNNPFIAYAVINDGATPGQRSGDGAFIASSP